MRRGRFFDGLLVSMFCICLSAVAQADDDPQQLPLESLLVITDAGQHRFDVEVANTDDTRAIGLMHRSKMSANRGMLFDFRTDRMVTMWMRNTLIPLDMLFVRKDGVIVRIARNTTPHSERHLPSGVPVRAVLELNAGATELLGIEAGDSIEHAMFPAQ